MNFVFQLGKNSSEDNTEMLGGKGYTLNVLKKGGFLVPDGFVTD